MSQFRSDQELKRRLIMRARKRPKTEREKQYLGNKKGRRKTALENLKKAQEPFKDPDSNQVQLLELGDKNA